MKNNRIYINDWLELKPYENQTLTDNSFFILFDRKAFC